MSGNVAFNSEGRQRVLSWQWIPLFDVTQPEQVASSQVFRQNTESYKAGHLDTLSNLSRASAIQTNRSFLRNFLNLQALTTWRSLYKPLGQLWIFSAHMTDLVWVDTASSCWEKNMLDLIYKMFGAMNRNTMFHFYLYDIVKHFTIYCRLAF